MQVTNKETNNIAAEQIYSIRPFTEADLPNWNLFLHGKHFSLTHES